jgi:hypothetical protein
VVRMRSYFFLIDINLSVLNNYALRHQGIWGSRCIPIHVFLISALVGGVGQLHAPVTLLLRKELLVPI